MGASSATSFKNFREFVTQTVEDLFFISNRRFVFIFHFIFMIKNCQYYLNWHFISENLQKTRKTF